MALMRKGVIERQLCKLTSGRVYEALLIEADGNTPQPCHAFDIFTSLIVEDIDTLPPIDNEWADVLVHDGIQVRVQVVAEVALVQCFRCAHMNAIKPG